MAELELEYQLSDKGDDFYALLMDGMRDLDEETMQRVMLRMVLLLANHVGDFGVINQAFTIACQIDTVPE